ncbi:DMT family transporter [Salidesulfovibrio onnuriiensis]|uniref:DMT family transporter n=1 Tax=Salidesulfovibrio onnuriiensis TaxID=2583823 RepID=UPI0011CB6A73|nr:DMT family transporter [Salidesulfovibrio onnuriiensis]
MNESLWFPLSLATAILTAGEATLLRRFFSGLRPWEMTAKPFIFSSPLFGLTLLFMPMPELKPGFWPLMAITVPLTTAGIFFNLNAFRLAPISLTMPLLSFTPAFAVITGFLFLDEIPSLMGFSGILLIISGSYIININRRNQGFLAPFRAIIEERGSRYMLFAALIYGLCSVLGKMIVLRSSAVFSGSTLFLTIGLVVTIFPVATGRASMKVLISKPLPTLMTGTMVFVETLCHNSAIALIDAAYMIAIKRLNGLFGVIFGWLFFREDNIRSRLAGAVLMSAGAALIVLFG